MPTRPYRPVRFNQLCRYYLKTLEQWTGHSWARSCPIHMYVAARVGFFHAYKEVSSERQLLIKLYRSLALTSWIGFSFHVLSKSESPNRSDIKQGFKHRSGKYSFWKGVVQCNSLHSDILILHWKPLFISSPKYISHFSSLVSLTTIYNCPFLRWES